MGLTEDLENARPGQVITFYGEERLGRVENVRGTPEAWVTLEGEGPDACLVPDRSYPYACARFADCRYLRLRNFTIDGEGFAERGLQIWTSEHVELEGLVVFGVRYDGLHFVGSNHTATRRYKFDGAGGDWLQPGVAGHGAYWTILDGGDDVADHLLEDAEVVDCLGAPFQANGENRWVRDVTMRRCLATAWRNGCGVNLGRAQEIRIEDLTLSSSEEEANGGVRGFDGSSGITVVRYDIQLPPGVPRFEGDVDTTAGTPAPPDFSESVPIPPEPGPEPGPEPVPEEIHTPCPTCSGVGLVMAPEAEPGAPATLACQTCGGSGWITVES